MSFMDKRGKNQKRWSFDLSNDLGLSKNGGTSPTGENAVLENLSLRQGLVQQENEQTSRMNTQEHMFDEGAPDITDTAVTADKKDTGTSYKLNPDNSITKTVDGKDYVVSAADRRYDRISQEMKDTATSGAGGTGSTGSTYSARKDQDAYLSTGKSNKQDYSDVEVRSANASQGNGVAYDTKTGNITVITPEGHKTVLQYGKDYYIGSDQKAYYKNDKTKAIVAVGDNNNNTWAISKDGSTIRNKQNNYRLYKGQDYYIGADGVAYFYSDVRAYNTARGVGVAWSGNAIHLKTTDGRTYELKEGSNFYLGADGKAHYFNGPPSPNPEYWEEADDDADPDWLSGEENEKLWPMQEYEVDDGKKEDENTSKSETTMPSGTVSNEDKRILTAEDQQVVQALSSLYKYYKLQGDMVMADAMHMRAAEIRSKKEYKGKFEDHDTNGSYLDQYKYTDYNLSACVEVKTTTIRDTEVAELAMGLVSEATKKVLPIFDYLDSLDSFMTLADPYEYGWYSFLNSGDVGITVSTSLINGADTYRYYYRDGKLFVTVHDRYIEPNWDRTITWEQKPSIDEQNKPMIWP